MPLVDPYLVERNSFEDGCKLLPDYLRLDDLLGSSGDGIRQGVGDVRVKLVVEDGCYLAGEEIRRPVLDNSRFEVTPEQENVEKDEEYTEAVGVSGIILDQFLVEFVEERGEERRAGAQEERVEGHGPVDEVQVDVVSRSEAFPVRSNTS